MTPSNRFRIGYSAFILQFVKAINICTTFENRRPLTVSVLFYVCFFACLRLSDFAVTGSSITILMQFYWEVCQ